MNNLKKEMEIYIDYCEKQKKLDSKTVYAYKKDLNQFCIYASNNSILDKNVIKGYIVDLHMNYKPKTVKRKIASIKAFYAYLEYEEIIVDNPLRKTNIKFKEDIILPKTIPLENIEILLKYMYKLSIEEVKKDWKNNMLIRDIVIIELLFSTGMRISELCNLKDEAFNLANGVLCIKGKGAKERYLQIENNDVIQLLTLYREKFKLEIEKTGYFIVNRYGKKLSDQSARKMLYKYTKLASINMHITPHMFRHAFATLLLEEDVDIRYIQKMLGHSSIVTTQIYTNVSLKKQGEILKRKHPRNKMNIDHVACTLD